MSAGDVAIIVAAVIAAVGTIIAGALTLRNGYKLGEIHVLVNGNAAAVKAELVTAQHEIQRLNTIIENLSQLRSTLSVRREDVIT